MSDLKVGVTARLKQPVVAGEISDARYSKERAQMEFLMDYIGADGEPHSRWFLESELEKVPAKEPENA
jgi:hypothetical protein